MTDEIRISVGDICLGLLVEDAEESARIRNRYGAFLSQAPPSMVLEVAVVEKDWPRPPQPGLWPLSTTRSGSLLRFESLCEEAAFDVAAGQGRLTKAPEIPGENSLRVIFAWLCLLQGGILVHSCGVVKEGRGYLFFGPSGAGKSTVASLSTDYTVLSDDLVMVRRVNGGYHAQGVPFRGEASNSPLTNAHAPLAGVFRLIKDARNYLEPVPGATMVASLVAAVPFVQEDSATSQRAADICAAVLSAVNHGRLHFQRDSTFWEVIADHD